MVPDYEAVVHVLTAPQIAHRTAPYIGADDFDFAGLVREAETMSGGQAVLIRIAADLWNADRVTAVWEVARKLDAENFERVVDALRIARGAQAWGALAA
jgi:ABC-type uncharacterized transport system ATPase subunit